MEEHGNAGSGSLDVDLDDRLLNCRLVYDHHHHHLMVILKQLEQPIKQVVVPVVQWAFDVKVHPKVLHPEDPIAYYLLLPVTRLLVDRQRHYHFHHSISFLLPCWHLDRNLLG